MTNYKTLKKIVYLIIIIYSIFIFYIYLRYYLLEEKISFVKQNWIKVPAKIVSFELGNYNGKYSNGSSMAKRTYEIIYEYKIGNNIYKGNGRAIKVLTEYVEDFNDQNSIINIYYNPNNFQESFYPINPYKINVPSIIIELSFFIILIFIIIWVNRVEYLNKFGIYTKAKINNIKEVNSKGFLIDIEYNGIKNTVYLREKKPKKDYLDIIYDPKKPKNFILDEDKTITSN